MPNEKGWYVGLYTDVEQAVEVSGLGYARIFVPFEIAEGGEQFSNPTHANFPEARGSWGTVVGIGLHTGPTGPAVFVGRLDTWHAVDSGVTLNFLPENLRIGGPFIPEVEAPSKLFPKPKTIWERLNSE